MKKERLHSKEDYIKADEMFLIAKLREDLKVKGLLCPAIEEVLEENE